MVHESVAVKIERVFVLAVAIASQGKLGALGSEVADAISSLLQRQSRVYATYARTHTHAHTHKRGETHAAHTKQVKA